MRDDLSRLGTAIDRALRIGSPAEHLLLLTLAATALVTCLQPITEYDSMCMLRYLQGLHRNVSPLHPTPFHYVVLWEISYLPSMAFTRTDHLLWLTSLKPVLLFAVLLYRLGIGLSLSRSLAALGAVNVVLLSHFWIDCSGVGTLKNDMMHACGAGLFALGGLRLLRERLDRQAGGLLAAAPIFITVKYSGLPESVAAFGVLALLSGRFLLRSPGLVVRWAALSVAAWLLTSGHYYAWNVWFHGNPFHPFMVRIGPLVFPGVDLSGTSILDSLGDPALWDLLFPHNRLSTGGVWFPLTLASGLVAGVVLTLRGGLAAVRGRPFDPAQVFLALLTLCLWLVYCRSYWSASFMPGDLFYLRGNQLNSLRYAEGVLGVTELFLLALIVKSGAPDMITKELVVTSMVSRVALTYQWFYWGLVVLGKTLLVLGPTCLTALLVLTRIRCPRHKATLAALGLLFLTLCVPVRFERERRLHWFRHWRVPISALDKLPPGRVYLVYGRKDFSQREYELYHYFVTRGKFDADVQGVTEEALLSGQSRPADYLVYLRELGKDNLGLVRNFESRITPLGYEPVSGNAFGTVLRRIGNGSTPAPDVAVRTRVIR